MQDPAHMAGAQRSPELPKGLKTARFPIAKKTRKTPEKPFQQPSTNCSPEMLVVICASTLPATICSASCGPKGQGGQTGSAPISALSALEAQKPLLPTLQLHSCRCNSHLFVTRDGEQNANFPHNQQKILVVTWCLGTLQDASSQIQTSFQ